MKLFLCEKPSAAATYVEALGGDTKRDKKKGYYQGDNWIVCYLAGHVYELLEPGQYKDEWKRWNLESLPIRPEQFRYQKMKDKEDLIQTICGLLKKADEVVIATDAGQEGQLMGEIFLKETGWKGRTWRVWSSEMEINGLRKAIREMRPNSEYAGIAASGDSREKGDWLLGINFSRCFTLLAQERGYDFLVPAGRVQSPILHIVANRKREIDQFKAGKYYELSANLVMPDGTKVEGKVNLPDHLLKNGHCTDKDAINQIMRGIQNAECLVSAISKNHSRKAAPLPFTQTDLQIHADKQWQFPPAKTLETCQSLYETYKLLSYPRTGSDHYETDELAKAPKTIAMLGKVPGIESAAAGADISNPSSAFDTSKVVEHAALGPTGKLPDWGRLSEAERSIFKIVCLRYLAQFYPDVSVETTSATLSVGSYTISLRGQTVLELGWSAIISEEKEDVPYIPELQQGQTISIDSFSVSEKSTRPPKRYSRGDLLAIMKNAKRFCSPQLQTRIKTASLGTDATRASILEGLELRDLLVAKGNIIDISKRGLMADEIISQLASSLTTPDLTAMWEIAFRNIKSDPTKAVQFKQNVNDYIGRQLATSNTVTIRNNPLAFTHDCGGVLTRRTPDKGNPYWQCRSCREYVDDDKGRPVKPIEGHGSKCPKCASKMITKMQRNTKSSKPASPYLSCSNRNCPGRNSNKGLQG